MDEKDLIVTILVFAMKSRNDIISMSDRPYEEGRKGLGIFTSDSELVEWRPKVFPDESWLLPVVVGTAGETGFFARRDLETPTAGISENPVTWPC